MKYFHAFQNLQKEFRMKRAIPFPALKLTMGENLKIKVFSDFYEKNGFQHNFSTPYTPEQNGVVKRKNRSLQEMARTMLIKS